MNADTQFYINGAFVIFGGLVSWIVTTQRNAMADLKNSDTIILDKLNNMEVLVAGQYVKHVDLQRISEGAKQDLQRMENTLLNALEKLDKKLDGKADKQTCNQIHHQITR